MINDIKSAKKSLTEKLFSYINEIKICLMSKFKVPRDLNRNIELWKKE